MSEAITRLTPEGRYLRGAVGMGVTWAVGWSFVGALLALLVGVLTSPDAIQGTRVAGTIRVFMQVGLVSGGAFSVVLAIAGRRRTFDEMSLPLFAGWGALASLLAYVAIMALGGALFTPGELLAGGAFTALLGAGSAAGSLALARTADDRDLLQVGADVAEVGLTKEEKRELLGK